MKLNKIIQNPLRNYQQRVVTKLWRWFKKNKIGNPLIKVPTGGGKTHILAQIVIDALSFNSTKKIRIIVLTQDTTLVKQNSEKFFKIAPSVDAGVFSAKLDRRDTENQIIFASIQSVYKRDDMGEFDLIIVDECHQIPPKGDGMYQTFISKQKVVNKKVRIVGLTATDYRLTTGKLTDGKNPLFKEVVAEVTLKELLELGFLVPIRYVKTPFTVSMDKVNVRGYDYNRDEAADVMMEDNRTDDALNDTIAKARMFGLKKWKIYCANVKHCEAVLDYLTSMGIEARVIDGNTKQKARDKILEEYRDGNFTALISCETLITGFDETAIDLIVNLKPTKSKGRWVQLCGRGMRPHLMGTKDAKKECMLLDYTENTHALGRADMIEWSTDCIESPSHLKSRVIRCPQCNVALNRYDQHCDNCDFVFDYSRPLVQASEAIVSYCAKAGYELPKGLSLFHIHTADIKPAFINKQLCLQIRFFGTEVAQKVKTSGSPFLSEFIPFTEMKEEFVTYFTDVTDINVISHLVKPQDFAREVANRIVLPEAVITKQNEFGYNYSVAYVHSQRNKLHWQNDQETVIRDLLAA
ncbi:DEAD/DEAH box helicase [Vibrio sp. Y2-5]|uniref:DEAD/DEAH box helicase n=1 Tax=Vibrio sp. Y2-5 TaxID=2743977 RepID=UPI001661501C|nr:DEAD/DEAH box helicase [Vibrio sp. Y2-5]MBD0788018.1 DEAD/DEAH box helicase [Vibrio sp. Y2-5]